MSLIVLPAAVANAAAATNEPRPVRRARHGEAHGDGEHRRRDVVGPHHDYEAQDFSHQRSRTSSSQPRFRLRPAPGEAIAVALAESSPTTPAETIRSMIQIIAKVRRTSTFTS